MVFREVEDGYLIRLEIGEELTEMLTGFVSEKKIEAGFIAGLGGATKAVLGYYNLKRKKYIFRHIKNVVELVSLQGNISWIGDQPALHLHAVVSDKNNKAHGGHVKELICGGTIEIHLRALKEKLEREVNPEIGLPLLKI